MKWLILLLTFFVAAQASEKPKKHVKKTAKSAKHATPAAKSSKATKPVKKTATAKSAKPAQAPIANVVELDKLCRHDQSWGKLQAVRDRCSDLEPRTSAPATYWRLTLSDDPNDLRKGFTPANLAKGDVDPRLLLTAGRYHFARGQIHEMEDLVDLAHKKKLAGPEIDTLQRLADGK